MKMQEKLKIEIQEEERQVMENYAIKFNPDV